MRTPKPSPPNRHASHTLNHPMHSPTSISDRLTRIVSQVDSGSWKHSRVPAYRIIGECEELLSRPRVLSLLTDAERQWLVGVTVWIGEALEDSARGEGVYME